MENINHEEYQKKIKKYSDNQLRAVIEDAREAIHAMPDGNKAGYYADEIHYCLDELKRRDKALADHTYNYIEISDGMFIDADTKVFYEDVKSGFTGFRSLRRFLPDKEIVTVSSVTDGVLEALKKIKYGVKA